MLLKEAEADSCTKGIYKLTVLKGRDPTPVTEPRPRDSTSIHAEFIDRERPEVSDS